MRAVARVQKFTMRSHNYTGFNSFPISAAVDVDGDDGSQIQREKYSVCSNDNNECTATMHQ